MIPLNGARTSFRLSIAFAFLRAPPSRRSPNQNSVTPRLIPEGAVDPKYIEESMDTPDTGSFMHLHLGIDGKGLDDLDIHYSVRRKWIHGG